jgi:glycosyltransferase involved in cell wall biosynthesis
MSHARRPVVMLANGHPPFDTRIFVKEARTLTAAGYAVSIILPHNQDEEKDGVKIMATAPLRGGFQKLFISPWTIFRKALQQPGQSIFVIHDSDILFTGLLLKLAGRKVVYDAHEDTPLQISYQHWIPKPLRKPYGWMYFLIEKVCGWMFDAIIVAEPIIARYFPEKKTYLVRNFPSATSFREHPGVSYTSRKPWMTYVGALTEPRGLYEMLEGAKAAASHTTFDFVLGGKFSPPHLEADVLTRYKVNFLGWVSYSGLVDLLFESKVGIIIPHPNPRYVTNYPVKLFEFMAAGLPVIASKEGEAAKFVQECNGGILVNPLDEKEVCDAIVWLFTHPQEAAAMGARGQKLIFEKYNWEKEQETLLKAIQIVN